ncbi:hypothetical protein B0T20DRAFT_397908 [Sordaria brevicollis]|uniref:Uncharacterized protein n=1 Tax=Sordaria brevicollis TaxID=83679 RepID=A0AAE0NVF0_SORBR|nr:hypothetical protein B0T20DRAFT_397908 [Sordaria brevicollis]
MPVNFNKYFEELGEVPAGYRGAPGNCVKIIILKDLLNVKPKINDIINRKSATFIANEFIYNDLDNGVRFTKSPTGFSNTELIFNWLKYFNYYSFYLSLIFTKLREEDNYKFPNLNKGINIRNIPSVKRIYYIFIIDSFNNYYNFEVKVTFIKELKVYRLLNRSRVLS